VSSRGTESAGATPVAPASHLQARLFGQKTDNKRFDHGATASRVSNEIVFGRPLEGGNSCTSGAITLTLRLHL
jgi:hypothetical protein